jgi:hypothetical protein
MTRQILDWKTSLIPGMAAIRKTRHDVSLRIEVCAFDRAGRFFSEVTETSDVSESGCRCCLRTEISRDAILAIRIVSDCSRGSESSRPILFRTVRMERSAGGWMVGATKLQQNDVWLPSLAGTKKSYAGKLD